MQRTVNYDLCQYEGSDKTSYLINYNGDMLKIDTAIKGAKDAADNAQSKADTADGKADANASSISTLDTQINGVSGLAADVSSVQGSVNTINSLIGSGEPTTTNKTIIGAINEINAKDGELSDLTTTNKTSLVAAINEVAGGQGGTVDADDVSYDNTTSGLVATNVQDAIDELAGTGGVKTIAEVTADGVKTISVLFDELYAAIGNDDKALIPFSILKVGQDIYRASKVQTTEFDYINAYISGNAAGTMHVAIKASSSVNEVNISGATTDYSSTVPTDGSVYGIYVI